MVLFKIGDKVKIVRNTSGAPNNLIGTTSMILDIIEGEGGYARCDNHFNFYFSDLELADKPQDFRNFRSYLENKVASAT